MTNEEIVADKIKEYEVFKKEAEERESKTFEAVEAGLPSATMDTVNMHAKINNEHIKLYKSLDPDHIQGSDKQKHGGAAERKEVHDRNVEKIKNGKEPNAKLSESGIDQSADFYDGKVGYQSKFCESPQKTFNALMKKDTYDGVKKIVPKDQGGKICELAKKAAKDYKTKAEQCKANGDMDGYQENMKLSKRAENIAKTTVESDLTYEDSKKLIVNKKKDLILNTAKDCHSAGMDSMKAAGKIAVVFNGAKNIVEALKGNEEWEEAIKNTVVDTAKASASAYAVGFTATAVSTGAGALASAVSNNTVASALESFGKGAAPAIAVVGTVELTKSIYRYAKGDIDGAGLVKELGEKTAGLTASVIVGNVVGAATASVPVVGPFIAPLASMIAYTISTSIYNSVIETIKILRSTEEIQRLFQFYKDAYENLCEQRKQLMSYLDQQTQLRKNIVMSAFTEMETSIFNNDLSKFNQNLGRVLDIYADGLLFQSKSDFDKTIRNRIQIKI